MNVGDKFHVGTDKELEVLEFLPDFKVKVRFTKSGLEREFQKSAITAGRVKDFYAPSVYGVGYIGEGSYNSRSKHYKTWSDMLARCYSEVNTHWHSGTAVVDEWHNLQNFCEWAIKTKPDSTYTLDKDLTGGTVYGPETCVWLPGKLNNLINLKQKKASNLPLGVTFKDKKYVARCNDWSGATKHLGRFSSPGEAAEVYKVFKMSVIRQAADEYLAKGLICKRVHELFYNFEKVLANY